MIKSKTISNAEDMSQHRVFKCKLQRHLLSK